MKTLDVATLPLQGTHLIEASAGTGKTFTLAHLYLRLIVERDLRVEQILVVTFTRAAVQELRTRLRSSIVEAREVLKHPERTDSLVAELLRPHLQQPNLAERLEAAQLSMDQASISTIHTFCMQLLSDNAFESGQLFDMQVEDRDDEMQLQAVQDYWRSHYLGLDHESTDWIHHDFGAPRGLLSEIKPLLSANPPRLLPAGDKQHFERAREDMRQRWIGFCQHWQHDGADIRALIDQSKALNGNKVRSGTVLKAAEWLNNSCQQQSLPGQFPDFIKVFRQSHLDVSVKKAQVAPTHVFFERVDELWNLLAPLSAMRMVAELSACADYVKVWLQQHKAKLRLMSYEDLLHYAAAALQGEGSEALATRLRMKFPAALIDEFQDTDPRQYGIFSTLYGGQQELAWYMIGDPKQAIYSFRGADINTYLQAAAASRENRHTLATNWRSTSQMVAAVNALFQNNAHAFAMHSGEQRALTFQPVAASGKVDGQCLNLQGETQRALRVALLDTSEQNKPLNKSAASKQAAVTTAALISQQLQAGLCGELLLGESALVAANIAVLVRSNRQGKLINHALSALGIASVVTGNDSIFASREATNLRRLLQALAEPSAERLLLRVLACDLCGYQAAELIYLQSADAEWQPHVELFAKLGTLLKRQGFLAALLALMGEYSSAARLRLEIGGERSLSNYLQLGELLQEAWQERPDLGSLQAWLERHCEDPGAAGEVAQLRLETDEKLVQIVTVHKSKGLEYPVVYLPFAWSARAPKSSDRVKCHSTSGPCVDFGSDKLEVHRELMREEELAEEVRLLYVALTRGSAQCTLLWGDVSQAQRSALARMLNQLDQKMAIGFQQGLIDWVGGCEQAELVQTPEPSALADTTKQGSLVALDCPRPPPPSWQISSYSALVRHASGHAEMPDYDAADAKTKLAEAPEHDPESIMFFPRGAQAGTFLHYLFEHADFPQCDGEALDKLVRDSLAAHGYAESWRLAVMSMMTQVLDAPLLPVANLRLRDLEQKDRMNEMGFHFPVPSLSCDSLLDLLRQHGVLGANEKLEFDTVHGYMTGFVDLIFRHDDKYYVLDYKSNHLGYTASDYHPRALQTAMQEHRYDLQYLMYTVALHRYLATRITDYDYEQHMGGSFYLFLRGMRIDDPSAPGIYFHLPPRGLIEAMDELFATQPEVQL